MNFSNATHRKNLSSCSKALIPNPLNTQTRCASGSKAFIKRGITARLSENGHEHFFGYVTFPLYDLDGSRDGIDALRLAETVTGCIPVHLNRK